MAERAEQTADDESNRRRWDSSWNAEAIRRLRQHANLSQRELAEELNARQQTISEWERGEYSPRGTAARLLTRVAEDVLYPFGTPVPGAADAEHADEEVEAWAEADGQPAGDQAGDARDADEADEDGGGDD